MEVVIKTYVFLEHFRAKQLRSLLEFRLLVAIGRIGVMIGRFCLNTVS